MKITIHISEATDGITCELQGNRNGYFDISLVLGDFIKIRKTEEDQPEGKGRVMFIFGDHQFTKEPDDWHPQSLKYYEDEYYEDVRRAFEFYDKYQELQKKHTRREMDNLISFEALKNKFWVRFTYEISILEDETDDAVITYSAPIGDFSEIKRNKSLFTYNAHSVTDTVAAVLHYYLLNGYKLKKCMHCGSWFATKDMKEKYCKRNSLYRDEYSQKASKPVNCEQTVRNAVQQQKRKRARILNNMRQDIRVQLGEFPLYNDFRDMCDEFVVKINKEPSISNLKTYNEYLEIIENSWKNGGSR